MDASDVAARARTVSQLAGIVQAMRTLANAQRRQAQERFSGLARYAAATRAALGEALVLVAPADGDAPGPPAARRVVVLFSQHGFVGGMNEALLERASALARARRAALVGVGGRGRRLCLEKGVAASDGGSMPTTLAAVSSTAQRLIESLFGDVAARRIGEIHVVFAEHRPPAGWAPREVRLFPPDVAASPRAEGDAPIHTIEPRALAARAMEEYAFAQVSWAVAEAFASERAARFVAMDAAHRHIDDKLAELQALERALRQEAVTNEILEIVSGAESADGGP